MAFLTAENAFDFVVGAEGRSFTGDFMARWDGLLDGLEFGYSNARQLRIGNRLRPQLACWGYMLTHQDDFDRVRDEATTAAVCVELIHKASIILDDFVDDDVSRHGEPAFHMEFGKEATAVFSGYMTNLSIQYALEHIPRNAAGVVGLLSKTIESLAEGALLEFGLPDVERDFVAYTSRIIEGETVALLANALLFGAISSPDERAERMLAAVGSDCARIFQILNDMEPFFNPKMIESHKGEINIDIKRNRKNILVASLMDSLPEPELSGFPASSQWLAEKMAEHGTKARFDAVVREKWGNVMRAMSDYRAAAGESPVLAAFERYIRQLYDTCLRRADGRCAA
ncbi:MAG: polyprenyl synthetase family protein [Clostridiales Family XIII bacterium]|jgi:heptaprenyl diphosphate synthase|nr:polyprenyl synthetase family protein [Clostridiales Family XIII bacterium]